MSDFALNDEASKAADIIRRGEWVAEEYEAGYEARIDDAPQSVTATACWRIGWQEAERELTEAMLRQQATASWNLDQTDTKRDAQQLSELQGSVQ